jgi:hypothetical protein
VAVRQCVAVCAAEVRGSACGALCGCVWQSVSVRSTQSLYIHKLAHNIIYWYALIGAVRMSYIFLAY